MVGAVCHAMAEYWRSLTDALAVSLRARGLDLVHPFRVSWCDDSFPPPLRRRWLDHQGTLGVLIGNTRALWPPFLAQQAADSAVLGEPDPLDHWIEQLIGEVLPAMGIPHHVVFAHEAPPRRLPFQRLAARAGLAPLSPAQILAHPVYGPWFALRAVVLFAIPGPDGDAPDPGEPCAGCAAPCLPVFEQARAAMAPGETEHVVHENWRLWLRVRDSCPVGREYRYCDEQILFHYAGQWPGG